MAESSRLQLHLKIGQSLWTDALLGSEQEDIKESTSDLYIESTSDLYIGASVRQSLLDGAESENSTLTSVLGDAHAAEDTNRHTITEWRVLKYQWFFSRLTPS
jgi:hypothetical protein